MNFLVIVLILLDLEFEWRNLVFNSQDYPEINNIPARATIHNVLGQVYDRL